MSPARKAAHRDEVLDRRPELACRGHRAGVVLGLDVQQVGERVDAPSPARRAPAGASWCGVMPSGSSRLVRHGLVPRHAPQPRHELAEHGIPDVGVVEPRARTEPQLPGGWPAGRPSRRPRVRSHHGPEVSACRPEVCESSWAIVTCAEVASAVSGRWAPIRVVAGRARPSSRSRRTSTPTKVLVIEPMRYCVSRGRRAPRRRDPSGCRPRRTTPARRRGPARPPRRAAAGPTARAASRWSSAAGGGRARSP